MVGKDSEDLYELLEGGCLEDSGWNIDSVMNEGEIEVKGMFKCKVCGKKSVSSCDVKKHLGMKHKNAKA